MTTSEETTNMKDYEQMYNDFRQKYDALLKRYMEVVKTVSNLGLDLQVFAKNADLFAQEQQRT